MHSDGLKPLQNTVYAIYAIYAMLPTIFNRR